MKKTGLALLLLVLSVLMVTTVYASDDVLLYGVRMNQFGNMDVHHTTASAPFVAAEQVLEPLLVKNAEGNVVPLLTEDLPAISEDGLVYSFKLKEGITFHDGSSFTTDDVVATFKKLLDPENVSVHAGVLTRLIVGASDYAEGQVDTISGLSVMDDYTFSITLLSPNVSFLNTLSAYWMGMYPAEAANIDGWGTTAFIGTGPFVVNEFRPNEKLVLDRYNEYHGGAKKLAQIVFSNMDENTALLEFEAGNIDVTDIGDPRLIAWYLSDDEFRDNVYRIEQRSIVALSFNLEMEPFTDVEVRRAISMAINRDEIADQLMQGLNSPAKSFLPQGVVGYDEELAPLEFNQEKAKEILANAGYPDGINISAITTDTAATTVILQYLEQSLKGANINLTIQTVDAAGFADIRSNGKIPMFILTWVSEAGDPNDFLNLYSTAMSQYISNHYMREDFDAELALGLQETDLAKREQLYQSMDYKLTRTDVVGAPIMHPNAFMLVGDRVGNLELSNGVRFYNVEIK